MDVNRGTGFSITKMTFYTEKNRRVHIKIVEVLGLWVNYGREGMKILNFDNDFDYL
jgi:hypothetical protein